MAPSNDGLPVTARLHWILGYAEAVARERAHPGVGPEHLQLAILRNRNAVPNRVLEVLGHEPEAVADIVSATLDAATDRTPADKYRILGPAADIARGLGHAHLGAEHVQLALLRDRDRAAARVLAAAEVGIEEFEAALTDRIRISD
ncbi:hypothetical protein NDR87_21185 [Nocardia sp. CDC159]|uniref:Clp R domain-containing protein n=1 Tax=Nocardia pulmonis TaxID=2951408 RepID=A0A9X2EBJ8_9NOCA|nr:MULTISPECIES: Clp protease N-terminal domain-containing protein [Nocardia]MCM6776460.1 hypothetical protein [Nocardia pulmonis]MCM6788884.1 hypothetical protein [Nocardia sp. CDC159]